MTAHWKYLTSATAIAAAFGLGMWSRANGAGPVAAPTTAANRVSRMAPPTRVGGRTVAVLPPATAHAPAPARGPEEAAPSDDVMTQIELGVDMKQLYDAQTRDETWAPPMEQFLTSQAKRFFAVFLPDAQDLHVECRSSMCNLQFVMASDPDGIAFGRQQVLPVGSTFHPWREELADGRVRIGLYSAFGPDQRAVAAMEKQFRERFGDLSPQQVLHYLEEEEAEMRKDRQH